jgi:hypothetical protein
MALIGTRLCSLEMNDASALPKAWISSCDPAALDVLVGKVEHDVRIW